MSNEIPPIQIEKTVKLSRAAIENNIDKDKKVRTDKFFKKINRFQAIRQNEREALLEDIKKDGRWLKEAFDALGVTMQDMKDIFPHLERYADLRGAVEESLFGIEGKEMTPDQDKKGVESMPENNSDEKNLEAVTILQAKSSDKEPPVGNDSENIYRELTPSEKEQLQSDKETLERTQKQLALVDYALEYIEYFDEKDQKTLTSAKDTLQRKERFHEFYVRRKNPDEKINNEDKPKIIPKENFNEALLWKQYDKDEYAIVKRIQNLYGKAQSHFRLEDAYKKSEDNAIRTSWVDLEAYIVSTKTFVKTERHKNAEGPFYKEEVVDRGALLQTISDIEASVSNAIKAFGNVRLNEFLQKTTDEKRKYAQAIISNVVKEQSFLDLTNANKIQETVKKLIAHDVERFFLDLEALQKYSLVSTQNSNKEPLALEDRLVEVQTRERADEAIYETYNLQGDPLSEEFIHECLKDEVNIEKLNEEKRKADINRSLMLEKFSAEIASGLIANEDVTEKIDERTAVLDILIQYKESLEKTGEDEAEKKSAELDMREELMNLHAKKVMKAGLANKGLKDAKGHLDRLIEEIG